MKRTAFAALLLCVLLSLSASADLIYLPESSYLEKHYDACTSVNRSYYVNGAEGYALLQKAPDDGTRVGAALNGTVLRVYVTTETHYGTLGLVECEKDEDGWCVQQGGDRDGSFTGWLPMDGMTLRYDSQAFLEEFSAELTDWDGDLRQHSTAADTVFWTYPGSGVVAMQTQTDGDIQFDRQYTDPEGRVWARVGYYRAIRDYWVCLDDPSNDALEQTLDRMPALTAAAEPPASARPVTPAQTWVWWLGGGLVLAAVAATLVLLRRRKRG